MADRTASRPQRDRAVSEIIGFVLIFGLSLGAIMVTSAVGINALTDATEDQPRKIATDELDKFRTNLYDHTNRVPYRTTALTGVDGTIHYGDPVSITVSGSSGSGSLAPQTVQAEPIVYDVGRTQIVSVAGMVILQDDNGGVALKTGPRFQIAPERSQLPLIKTSQSGGVDAVSPASGTSAYLVSHRWSNSGTRYAPVDGSGNQVTATISISVNTPRYEAWAEYFRSHPQVSSVTASPGSNTVTAEFQTKELLIQRTEVRLKFDQP
jgi:hypothetical protein